MVLAFLKTFQLADPMKLDVVVHLCASNAGRLNVLARQEGIIAGGNRLNRPFSRLACNSRLLPLLALPSATICLVGLFDHMGC